MFKHFQKALINSLLVVLLLGILMMPISSMGLMSFRTQEEREVLSVQDTTEKTEENTFIDYEKEEETYLERILREAEESTESTTMQTE